MLAALIGMVVPATPAASATKLLRYADIHGDRVVFTHGGDLWLASSDGGRARRLTSHPGVEVFAKFSPDGRTLAFTGQYEGDEQVYVMPADGGPPTQLTFYPARGPLPTRWGYDNQVYGWTPDGTKVVFRGMRDHWTISASRLYTVPRTGGAPVALAPPTAGAGALSPDGRRLFYSPLFRDFRTWKRYQGGWAQDLFVVDLERETLERVTDHPRTDRDPMWVGKDLFFSSDRSGRLNLFRYRLATRKTEQLTGHTDWDVRWPSAGPSGRIVYSLNGELRVFDATSGTDRGITVVVPSDDLARRPREVRVHDMVEHFGLSPRGERAMFVARGDVFDAPIEHGLTRNLTHSSNAHERDAQWSPDGKQMAFVSDVSGEEEIWIHDLQSGAQRRLTPNTRAQLSEPRWSPDARHIAYADQTGAVYVVELKTRRRTRVADDPTWEVEDYVWSPRGGFLAFSMRDPNEYRSLYIYGVADRKTRRVTSSTFHEQTPAWDPNGDHLYYMSSRDFRPQLGAFDFNFVGDREVGLFALALRKDVEHPFPPRNDEVTTDLAGERGGDRPGGDDDGEEDAWSVPALRKKGYIKIDFDGLGQRVARVPVATGNYGSLLAVTRTHIVLADVGAARLGRSDPEPKVLVFDKKSRKLDTLADDARGFSVSWDGKKVLVWLEEGYELHEIGSEEEPQVVSTAGLLAHVRPSEEWAAIFDEVWRRFRDYFYVANMHGYDWKALAKRYRPLLAHVAHRSDLNDVLGEMVAELEVSHAYISGGDLGLPDRPEVALPGARFELDAEAGRYRIAKIYEGHNQEDRYRSPLTEVGVDARVGDYVLAINGQELLATDNPYRLLRRPAKDPVELVLSRRPSDDDTRRVIYQPRATEQPLVYLEHVLAKKRYVDERTQNQVGYIHLPDMNAAGIYEFIKWYFPQLKKDALIVDVRANGGGFVSQLLIERLGRKVLGTSFARNGVYATTYPQAVMNGPMVCLMNETSGSDGDLFPWAFKEAELGPLIGKRSWGGVIGITDHGPLLDGGTVFVPEFSSNDAEGRYIIEGHGVEPDIVVDNDPWAVVRGDDPQLDRGIREINVLRAKKGGALPKRPAPPVRARSDAQARHGPAR